MMNDQIKVLMGQTLDEKFAGTWSTMDMQDLTKFAERFAELIVRECVGIVEGGRFLHDQAPTALFAKECSGAIKKHFGVEE